ncbi:MAG: LysR substrate-binding domain-containing protein [Anaeromyxobacteraceae bacterium]
MAPPPPLDALHVLATCVRHGSFSRAARELCLTPSAVSARIRNLEALLGVSLFERRGPRLTATAQGRLLAGTVDEAVAAVRTAVDRARTLRRALRVTCAPAFATRWLVPRLSAYDATAGAVPIALDATDAALPPDRFDVAIRSAVAPPPGYAALALLEDRGTPMLSPALWGSPRRATPGTPSPRRLLDLPLLADDRWPGWFTRAGLRGGAPRSAAARFASYELEAAAAVAGVGVALLCPVLYGPLVEGGALVAPFALTVDGPRRYWALWGAGQPAPHLVRWLADTLAAGVGTAAATSAAPQSRPAPRAKAASRTRAASRAARPRA